MQCNSDYLPSRKKWKNRKHTMTQNEIKGKGTVHIKAKLSSDKIPTELSKNIGVLGKADFT